jgi:hypothetical protein
MPITFETSKFRKVFAGEGFFEPEVSLEQFNAV